MPRPRMGHRVWVRIPDADLARIDAAAERDGRNRSDWIRRACARAAEETMAITQTRTRYRCVSDTYGSAAGRLYSARSSALADPPRPRRLTTSGPKSVRRAARLSPAPKSR
jgi:metal-responsive CopG/Arc/MetJ family transcriptional regulator